ncbi:MAG: hypothetical protein NTY70_16170 [Burkholderiales bacterium]|nr:hypothetical protein [Burkholderiales bacterium]
MKLITSVLPLLFFIFVAAIAIAIIAKKLKSKTATALIKAKIPLTKNEQPMFFRLVEAFPDQIVLAQVAFSALVTTKERAARNTFDRKSGRLCYLQ